MCLTLISGSLAFVYTSDSRSKLGPSAHAQEGYSSQLFVCVCVCVILATVPLSHYLWRFIITLTMMMVINIPKLSVLKSEPILKLINHRNKRVHSCPHAPLTMRILISTNAVVISCGLGKNAHIHFCGYLLSE